MRPRAASRISNMVRNLSKDDIYRLPETENCDVISFVNAEDRCRGLFGKATPENVRNSYIFKKSTETNGNAIAAKQRLGGEIADCSNSDEVELVSEILAKIDHPKELVIDISILNKPELLILMRALDHRDYLSSTRLVYSEPTDYISNDYEVPSRGIQNIDSIPGFINCTPLNRKTLLILMLGFEPARSKAIYNNYDPDETYLVVPHPPYQENWEGRTQGKNSHLVNVVGEEKIMGMHSRNPEIFIEQFVEFLDKNELDIEECNTFISPLSTKPQAIGLYFLWKKYKRSVSIVHSSPLEQNKLFVPTGISNTWEILGTKDEI